MLQESPVIGSRYDVIPSKTRDGLYSVLVGSTIVSYTVDPAKNDVMIVGFAGVPRAD